MTCSEFARQPVVHSVYGNFPLWKVPVKRWIICLLHLNLRIVGGMFNVLVRDLISKAGNEDQSAALYELLHSNGIWVKESYLKRAPTSLNAKQMPKISFIGVDTDKLMLMARDVEDIVHPPAVRAANPAHKLQYERSMACWDAWGKMWRLLNTSLDSNSPEARCKRGDEVEAQAHVWLKCFKLAHKKTQGLYIHIMVKHLPGMVRAVGDLRPFQSQGLEHSHSYRKMLARRLTNRQAGKRCATAMGHLIAQDYCIKDQRHDAEAREFTNRERTKALRGEKRVLELAAKGIVKT